MSYIFTSLGITDEHYIYQDIVFIVFNWILSSLEFFSGNRGDCFWEIAGYIFELLVVQIQPLAFIR